MRQGLLERQRPSGSVSARQGPSGSVRARLGLPAGTPRRAYAWTTTRSAVSSGVSADVSSHQPRRAVTVAHRRGELVVAVEGELLVGMTRGVALSAGLRAQVEHDEEP